MSMQDTMADMATRIRNAQRIGKEKVSVPDSRLKRAVLDVLKREGYIADYQSHGEKAQATIEIELKYYQGASVIEDIQRVSRPSLRVYRSARELPQIKNGFGVAVVSTSRGVLSDAEARREGVGGEILLEVF